MKDCNGREIQVGDKVVVANRRSSASWITAHEVKRLKAVGGGTLPEFLRTRMGKVTGYYAYKGSPSAIMVITPGSPAPESIPGYNWGAQHCDPLQTGDSNSSQASSSELQLLPAMDEPFFQTGGES